jgi:alanine racemase
MRFKTCAEINLDALAYNVGQIRKKVSPARIIAVVKADAYGHGAIPVARRLVAEGIDLFAVAQFQEAMELRDSGIVQPVLVLGRIFPAEISQAIKAGLRITVFGEEDLRWIEDAAADVPAFVHVKLDTGMGRIGVLPDRASQVFDRLVRSGACFWEGLFSHFSTSDEFDKTYSNLQFSRFQETLSIVSKLDKKPQLLHMAASGGILDLPMSHLDAVRPGILMYGHYPSRETSKSIVPRQVMSLKTFVAHLRRMPAGHPVSYGRRWTAPMETTIAVLPIGYADGISRRLTNQGEVLIRGKLYPMVGTVTMDHIMVDVGNDPVQVGDEVLIWGNSPQGEIQILDVAEKIGTIPYELTCGVSRRVRRVHVGAVNG